MANFLQRAAVRLLGLPAPEAVTALQNEVATLERRVRMRPGASGVPIQYGQFEYEYLQALRGDARWLIYDKMESDPHIKEGLDSIVLPLVTGEWEIQAASDKPIDQEIKEFVSSVLLRTGSDQFGREYWTQTSWIQRLVEILDMAKCGYSLFGKSTREVEGKIVYDRLQWLEPRSVDPRGWALSEKDELVSIKRTYRTPTDNPDFRFRDPIDAKQVALYVWDLKGARYEGRPRIRSAYGAFIRKEFVLRQSVIWAQKAGAPMPVGHYPQGMAPEHIALVEEAVKAARGEHPAEAYALFPKDADGNKVEIEFLGVSTGAAQVDRMRGLIDGENSEMAHALATKSKQLGETKTGSRAVGDTQSADEDISVEAVAKLVCEFENHGVGNLPGLIQQLVDWNYPGVKRYPELAVSRIGPREDTSTLTPLIAAVGAGLVPRTVAVMKQVTEKFGIHLKDEEYQAALDKAEEDKKAQLDALAKSKGQEPGGSPQVGQKPGAPPVPEKKTALALASTGVRRPDISPYLVSAPGATPLGDGRPPNVLESTTAHLAQIKHAMEAGGNDIHNDLRVIKDGMVLDLQARLRAGLINTRNIDGLRRSRYRGSRKASEKLQDTLTRIGETGAAHVSEEIERGRTRRS